MAAGEASALTVFDQWDHRTATVTVHGDIDIATAGAFRDRLVAVANERPARVVIDLADVRFLDSAGLRAFVQLRKALPKDCQVVIRSPRRRTRQVFELTGLDTAFEFE